MAVALRPATQGDADAIAALWNPVIRDTLFTFNAVEKSAADIAELIAAKTASGHPFLLGELDGALAGFVTYSQFRGGVGYARTMEHTIILAESARGHGLGRALMRAVEDQARQAGIGSLIAGVSAANPQGRAFHAALGYREIAVLPAVGFKWGRWIDLVLMQKLFVNSAPPGPDRPDRAV
ncbi:MAG: N-acetyltransferase family protein [Paracoccaceae bacterium]